VIAEVMPAVNTARAMIEAIIQTIASSLPGSEDGAPWAARLRRRR